MQFLHNGRMAMDETWFRGRLADLDKGLKNVGDALSLSEWQAGRILSGKQRLRLDEVPRLATVFDVSELEILYRAGLWGVTQPPIVAAPVLNAVEAGAFAEINPDRPPPKRDQILVAYHRRTVFALQVDGDSMDRVAPQGSFIVVDYAWRNLHDRDLCVVRRDGEATFKRYREDERGPWLEPDSTNSRHSPILPDDENPIAIIGLVIDIRPEARGKAAE